MYQIKKYNLKCLIVSVHSVYNTIMKHLIQNKIKVMLSMHFYRKTNTTSILNIHFFSCLKPNKATLIIITKKNLRKSL